MRKILKMGQHSTKFINQNNITPIMCPDDSWNCSLCGKRCSGLGNDPWPLKPSEESCCDECNRNAVVPERRRRAGVG